MKTSKQLYREKMIIDFGKCNNEEKKTYFLLVHVPSLHRWNNWKYTLCCSNHILFYKRKINTCLLLFYSQHSLSNLKNLLLKGKKLENIYNGKTENFTFDFRGGKYIFVCYGWDVLFAYRQPKPRTWHKETETFVSSILVCWYVTWEWGNICKKFFVSKTIILFSKYWSSWRWRTRNERVFQTNMLIFSSVWLV